MASSFLETNDTWNIHNVNIWHFSSFMNPDLEILSCFLGRLPFWYGVCHACSKAWPNYWSFLENLGLPTCTVMRLSGFKHGQGSATQIHSTQEGKHPRRTLPGTAAALPGTTHCWDEARWDEYLLPLSPGLPWGWDVKGGFKLPSHWVTSFSLVLKTKVMSFSVACLCTCMFFVLAVGLGVCLRHDLLKRWQFQAGTGEWNMFMILFKYILNAILKSDGKNQNLSLELFLC